MADERLYKCPVCDTENSFRIDKDRRYWGTCLVENERYKVIKDRRDSRLAVKDWDEWFVGE